MPVSHLQVFFGKMSIQIFCFFFFFFASPHGLWDLGSLTKDWTWAPCSGSTVITTGPPKFPLLTSFDRNFFLHWIIWAVYIPWILPLVGHIIWNIFHSFCSAFSFCWWFPFAVQRFLSWIMSHLLNRTFYFSPTKKLLLCLLQLILFSPRRLIWFLLPLLVIYWYVKPPQT